MASPDVGPDELVLQSLRHHKEKGLRVRQNGRRSARQKAVRSLSLTGTSGSHSGSKPPPALPSALAAVDTARSWPATLSACHDRALTFKLTHTPRGYCVETIES